MRNMSGIGLLRKLHAALNVESFIRGVDDTRAAEKLDAIRVAIVNLSVYNISPITVDTVRQFIKERNKAKRG